MNENPDTDSQRDDPFDRTIEAIDADGEKVALPVSETAAVDALNEASNAVDAVRLRHTAELATSPNP